MRGDAAGELGGCSPTRKIAISKFKLLMTCHKELHAAPSKTACSPSNCHDTIPAALRHTNNFYSADDTDNALENVMDVDSDDDTNEP